MKNNPLQMALAKPVSLCDRIVLVYTMMSLAVTSLWIPVYMKKDDTERSTEPDCPIHPLSKTPPS